MARQGDLFGERRRMSRGLERVRWWVMPREAAARVAERAG
jgi:hypothetical protein